MTFRKLTLIRRRTVEVVTRRQRFVANMTQRTTYKVSTVVGRHVRTTRVTRTSDVLVERVARRQAKRRAGVSVQLVQTRAQLIATVKQPMVDLMSVLGQALSANRQDDSSS